MIPLITGSASAVTDGETKIAHAVTLGVVGGMLLILSIWTAKGASKRNGRGCFFKWGPTLMVSMAVLLVNANNIRQVLQDNNVWKSATAAQNQRGWAGAGWMKTSSAYVCANEGHCCPSVDPLYGGEPRQTVYDKTCDNATAANLAACPHVDIPWSFVCDAGRGEEFVTAWLSKKCEENEGPLLGGAHWGCTAKPSLGASGSNATGFTNLDALLQLTNHTFVYGAATGKPAFRVAPTTTDCDAAKIPSASCGLIYSLASGCHVNMKLACLNSTGFTIIILCVYSGFTLMMVGSLWNAKICTKLSKARSQWDQLRAIDDSKPSYGGNVTLNADGSVCKT